MGTKTLCNVVLMIWRVGKYRVTLLNNAPDSYLVSLFFSCLDGID